MKKPNVYFKLNNKFDVPFLVGSSKYKNIIYIDKNLPRWYKGLDVHKCLAYTERLERMLTHKNKNQYNKISEYLLSQEKEHVERKGIPWLEYIKFLGDYSKTVDKVKNIPKDLNLEFYTPTNKAILINLIKKGNNNENNNIHQRNMSALYSRKKNIRKSQHSVHGIYDRP